MRVSRRVFLGCGAARVLAAAAPPSQSVTLAAIGTGWQGLATTKIFLNDPRVRVLAVCDLDSDHLAEAKAAVDEHYGNKDCAALRRFEDALARPDIDAVYMAVPDHWHGAVAVAAARAGKDIYGEKPLAHNWAEGRAICDAVKRYGRIWQTGSWQRSLSEFRFACELVRNGRLGKVTRVEVGLPAGHTDWDGTAHLVEPGRPPESLDYERWLGPAPYAPYAKARVHKTWRWNLDYGGGSLMDWVGHHVDIAHWGLGLDGGGPVEVEGKGEFVRHPVWDAPARFRITARYAGGLEMRISSGYDDVRPGTRWIGEDGWLWVDRSGMDANPRGLLSSRIGPGEIQLPVSSSHHRQFVDCVLARSETLTPAEVALSSATPGFLGLIATLTGRKIRWDPQKQKILNDPGAERMLGRPMRTPWHL